MINISICICTRRRPEGLKRLLASIENLEIPTETNIRIIIVENDSRNFSEKIVESFSVRTNFQTSYFLEPKQGVVYARNRSVAEAGASDFCCFTDDDQIVMPEWLIELVKCQQEFNADGVAGPTMPRFKNKVPPYIEKFHQPDTHPYGAIVESAFTGCLLIRKSYLDLLDGPFDIRLNYSGGEDSLLTGNITELGGALRFNPSAIAHEFVPEYRTTINFVIKRTFRISNTRLFINSIRDKKFTKTKALARLILRFCYGLLIFIPFFIFSKPDKLKGVLKITKAVGGFAFIFGMRSQFYK